uniref:MES13 (METHYL ESTERASE 13); hydrolase n=1 Tax=Solanum tuberosum TaxID=4113 RepID=M1DSD2_SOLTU
MHVILVGHDIRGDYVSYATDVHRSKVSKTVFIDAAMLKNGKSVLDIFTMQIGSNDFCQHSQKFLYANGKYHPQSAIDFDKSLLKVGMFNQSTAKMKGSDHSPIMLKPQTVHKILPKISKVPVKCTLINHLAKIDLQHI